MINQTSRIFGLTLCAFALLSACEQAQETGTPMADDRFGSAELTKTDSAICAGYSDALDILLCEKESLAVLATSLARLSTKAGLTYPDEEIEVLKRDQADWEKENTACLDSTDVLGCVRANYQARISELQIATGSADISNTANYLCNAGKHDYITAVFYNQTELPAVVLTRISDSMDGQKMAFRVRSGSGAKYQGRDVMFWSKGDEAQVLWADDSLSCTQQEQNSAGI